MMKFPFNSKGMIIGITGSTGSGKSVVSSFLKENGYKVIDFNQIIKETSQLNHIQKELINHFGTEDLDQIKQNLNPKTHFFLNQIISVPAMKETFRQTHEAFEKGEA